MPTAQFICSLDPSHTKLPLFLDRVPAGFPSPAQDYLEERISLDELLDINLPQTFLSRALGHSMTGAGIFDGDLMVVNKAKDAKRGFIVIACVNGEQFVKRLDKDGDNLVLTSENPDYPPRYVMEGDELRIWGVVTYSIRRHYAHA
ncbi:LexA family protein [uncultured Pseudomonas sp.]|uniref:LexA family protein n=1 Tax=uncultured Pseudomonas sp. TaxID=114707 RepID=UPI0025F0F847|nr:translesion error-prone DNA polymerase V autoproteolytic subunit [uncultured Pseudomonas sp.]